MWKPQNNSVCFVYEICYNVDQRKKQIFCFYGINIV
nr:MAG TPA: hypothetical protein [Caudoviricetes sp.]